MADAPHWSERVKNYVEILAILIGGSWALFTFVIKDKPSLSLRRKAASSLQWLLPPDKAYNKATFTATLDNMGTSTFHIQKAHLKVWICDSVNPAVNETVQFLDALYLEQKGQVYFDTTYKYQGNTDTANLGKPFIGRYNEGATWEEHFDFLVKNEPQKIILFYLTFYEQGNPTEPFEWTYQWDNIGGTRPNTNKESKKTSTKLH